MIAKTGINSTGHIPKCINHSFNNKQVLILLWLSDFKKKTSES